MSKSRISPRKLHGMLRDQESKRGLLIAFEGPDGSGKTTQRNLFKNWMKTEGQDLVTTKWNSSELVRPLIKSRKEARDFSPEEFCLLHAADFRHRVETEILPALWSGRNVLADRYLFTALARDAARGLRLDWILNVYHPMIWPDVVFYFAMSAETSGKRVAALGTPEYYDAGQDITNLDDPFESYQKFAARVIQEYDALATIFEFVTVDAEKPMYHQHRLIRDLFLEKQRLPWAEWNMDAMLEWLESKGGAPELPDA